MSDYSKSTNFTTKDTLPTGNAGKIVKGTELDTEFTAISSAIASKADVSSPALLGTPTAPTATTGSNTTQIANTAFVQTALSAAFTTGMIILWSGSIATIPSGWYLCNGSNSTPDLRNKFIIGAYADDSSIAKTTVTGSSTQTGGTKDAINVSHTHTATTTATDAGHTHLSNAMGLVSGTINFVGTGGTPYNNGNSTNTASGTATITAATTITSAGSDGTNQNLPPYYALAYIMKA